MTSDGRDFARFYEAEREPMARTLLVIGGDAEAACDAVAEAFLAGDRGRLTAGTPAPWAV